jgi:Cu2+-exporting ATPase
MNHEHEDHSPDPLPTSETTGDHGHPVATHAGPSSHDKHAGHSTTAFRDKFWISLLLTIPTLVWGQMLQDAVGYTAPAFVGSHWIPPVFGTAVFIYGGWVFVQGARRELRDRLPGMMTLIALAISVAFVFSVVVTLGYPGMPLWEELATLVTIMLLGHWLEMRSIAQELRDGDVVLVHPGQGIPADGVIRVGTSAINESMITGESRPLDKKQGDRVIAGTVNGAGSLRVEVTGTGDHTALAKIMRLVGQAQSSRSRAQALADRAAYWLTFVALGAGVVTVFTWLALGASASYAIERLVTVLVIACPHALGLAVPLVVAISTSLAAGAGLLVRDRRGLEEARLLTTVVFDKTGTLTRGEFGVVDIVTTAGLDPNEALRLTAALETDSEHTIAQGIVRTATDRKIVVKPAGHFEAIPGQGVRGLVDGRELYVGGPALLRSLSLEPAPELRAATERAAQAGRAAIYLADKQSVLAMLAVADVVRPESRQAIDELHRNHIDVIMITGDARAVAEAVGAELGVDQVLAEVLPADKASKIEALQAQGKRVAMVGDGVNDAPALVTADVGIAIGAGTDVAVDAGDVVLVRSDPRDVPRIIALSRASYRKMVQNLWWAAGYNVIAIPLAAGVLSHWGFVLSPAAGAVLMSASTIIVALNAQLLRRTQL